MSFAHSQGRRRRIVKTVQIFPFALNISPEYTIILYSR